MTGSEVGSYVSGSVTHDSGRILVDVVAEAPEISGSGDSASCSDSADVRDERTRLSVANVDVFDLGLIENSRDCRLGRSVIYFLAGGHPSIAAVTFEHERQRTKAVWKFILR